ncbi:hypothetical protein Tco_1335964 [Tanacetum coccineum]
MRGVFFLVNFTVEKHRQSHLLSSALTQAPKPCATASHVIPPKFLAPLSKLLVIVLIISFISDGHRYACYELRKRYLESSPIEITPVELEEEPWQSPRESTSRKSWTIITGKVPYLVALVAPLGARAIVVEMALVALGQGPPVRFPFRPCGVSVHQVIGQLQFSIQRLGFLADYDVPINVVQRSHCVTLSTFSVSLATNLEHIRVNSETFSVCWNSRFPDRQVSTASITNFLILPCDSICPSSFSLSTSQVIAMPLDLRFLIDPFTSQSTPSSGKLYLVSQ